ncbi:cellulose biosynthesis cyclic di-GMP-binding regulatory protein BcsB [Asaia astilbis]|uniref:cellulose biosynthesis cyclic di-GMP-binding regulatory protein BcsB n=1 Tax=Asaia astilbis TaxID=610244 RepID=UPI000A624429|nr:cellulose biosynthesis cyclic di-GMP-binding regulatory protein BcsB [Asaia astilbis]
MLQIFRIDNPLFGHGLTFAQRLCYFAAIASFLFAIPRLIFLVSPLAYLLFDQTLIAASPFAIAIYAVPHLVHSILTSARTNKNWRYSFWSEVYETTLAPFLARVTITTLLFPRRGKFNVTEKGGVLHRSYLDWSAIYPNVYLAIGLSLTWGFGVFRLLHGQNDSIVRNALAMNVLWISLSITIVLAAISIGRETMQIRTAPRVDMVIPVTVRTDDGRLLEYMSENMSQGGCLLHGEPEENVLLERDAQITVFVADRHETYCLPGQVVRAADTGALALRWNATSILQEAQIVRVIFGSRDAWDNWADYQPDSLRRSIILILHSIVGLFKPATFKRRKIAIPVKPRVSPPTIRRAAVLVKPKAGLVRLVILSLALFGVSGAAFAQENPADLPLPSALSPKDAAAGSPPAAASLPAAGAPPQAGSAPQGEGALTQPVTDNSTGAVQPVASREELENARTTSWSFKQLGSADTLVMTPWIPIQGLNFGMPPSEVVTSASLSLMGSLSPDLLPEGSGVTIFLNDQFVGVVHPDKTKPQFGPLTFPINPLFFREHNVLTFHFAGQYTLSCGDQTSSVLWAKILGQSSISVTSAPLPPSRDLAALPAPFFNEAVLTPVRLPFVLNNHSGSHVLEASGVLASWFGSLSKYRGASFPVLRQVPPSGNASLSEWRAMSGRSSSGRSSSGGKALRVRP